MRTTQRAAIVLAALFASTGCTTLGVELAHVSHPLRGAPFGPSYEEDTLDVLQVTGRKEFGRFYLEQSLGYRLRDGGFYGDDFVYMGTVGIRLLGELPER